MAKQHYGTGPRLGCGARLMKFILITFNLVFFILGIAITAIGIYVLVDPRFKQISNIANNDIIELAGENGINLSYIDRAGIAFCVFGGVMLLISFLGCCGACRQVKCLLGLYSSFLLVVLLAEIGAGILFAVYSAQLKTMLTPFLQNSIKTKYMGHDAQNKTLASIAWDAVMYNFECCGVANSTDFDQPENVWTQRPANQATPKACCKFKRKPTDWSGVVPAVTSESSYPGCYTSPTTATSNFEKGCYSRIEELVGSYSSILIGVSIGVGLVLSTGVIFGFYLCKRVGDMDDYV
jgi:hypothetical protein